MKDRLCACTFGPWSLVRCAGAVRLCWQLRVAHKLAVCRAVHTGGTQGVHGVTRSSSSQGEALHVGYEFWGV